jgi:ribosomal protein L37E
MSSREAQGLEVLGSPFTCRVCGHAGFFRREIKLQTTGMTFFELDWLNRSADGAICARCGFVHTFAGDSHTWVGPAAQPADRP